MQDLLLRTDIFWQNMPTFNVRGKEKVSTPFGGILTLSLLSILVLYGLLKLKHLLTRFNPNVSTFRREFALSSDDSVNFVEAGLRFAWTIEGYRD